MKQIKTVTAPIERSYWYDSAVNDLLADGWILKKREIMYVPGELSEAFNAPMVRILYAELEKEVPPYPEEITM